jgi:hypothetical protein
VTSVVQMLDRRSAERPTPCSAAQRDTRRSQRMDLIINQAIGPNDRNINPAANCMRLKGTRILLSRRRVSRFAAWLRVCVFVRHYSHSIRTSRHKKAKSELSREIKTNRFSRSKCARDWELRLQRGGSIFSRVSYCTHKTIFMEWTRVQLVCFIQLTW